MIVIWFDLKHIDLATTANFMGIMMLGFIGDV